MIAETVKLSSPFESFMSTIDRMNINEKYQVWEYLDRQIAQADEAKLETDPIVKNEIREARAAYRAGDYMSIDDYINNDKEKHE